MDSFILAYIAHRMDMLGFKKYSMEPLLLTWSYGGINEYVIQAQNEYYYLVSKTVNEGTEILADNNYFKAESSYISVDFAYIQEFTGVIKVNFPEWYWSPLGLEFIRVIPM